MALNAGGGLSEPVWKLDRRGSAGLLFWRRDSIERSGKSRVKFNYEVEVLEYTPHESEHCDEEWTLGTVSSTLHVLVVGLVCVAATFTTFSWLVQ